MLAEVISLTSMTGKYKYGCDSFRRSRKAIYPLNLPNRPFKRKVMRVIAASLLAALTLGVSALPKKPRSSNVADPTVTIKNGTLIGRYSPGYNQDFFLGIRYAQPPVGNLRFQLPQSLNTTFSEPQKVQEYSSTCVGYGVGTFCLFYRDSYPFT
jgi:hypothetical protein